MDQPQTMVHANMALLNTFWQTQFQLLEQGEPDFKNYQLPLARIKKVMKTDDEVGHMMISAEAPVIFSEACKVFILELTLRAWIHTEESKRRTLQKNDVAMAVAKHDMYDFLIDIIPRDDPKLRRSDTQMVADPYFFANSLGGLGYQAGPVDPSAQILYQQAYGSSSNNGAEQSKPID